MEGVVKKVALNFLSEKCYEEFFYNFNFFNLLCLKAFVSKCLGYVIIAGSCFVKLPQILKIWNNKSAKGISIINVFTDLFAITVNASYAFVRSFPISAYGEGISMGIQTVTIAAQVLHHNFSSSLAAAFVAVYGVVCYVMTNFIPVNMLWNLQAVTIPVLLFGKLAQAYSNYSIKGTGQLSAATCVMLLFGSTSRIFTSFQETGDVIIIITYLLATLGNGIIVFQFMYYRKPAAKQQKKKEGKKQR
ncbi:unnamed protein product [Nezara viridula]|uniref:Solute carrier family 66 member 3 n=1 Tax=Nezara viridula TaxID=85310 RepID=A0A9P0H732_NEZVI|nr:unnamed protein product [Nezara viridula]